MEIFEPEATGRNSVAQERKELPEIGWCQNDRNFGGFAAVHSDFYVEGPKRAFLALFWAPGGLGSIFFQIQASGVSRAAQRYALIIQHCFGPYRTIQQEKMAKNLFFWGHFFQAPCSSPGLCRISGHRSSPGHVQYGILCYLMTPLHGIACFYSRGQKKRRLFLIEISYLAFQKSNPASKTNTTSLC